MDNCVAATDRLLQLLKVEHTKAFLEDGILSHADHPSLLAISDTLHKYHIENLAVKIDGDKLQEVPLPCIVQLSDRGQKVFLVLTSISDQEVSYQNENKKTIKLPTSDFLEKWTGICLLAEISEISKEPEIEKRRTEKRILNTLKIVGLVFLLAWGAFGFANSEFLTDTRVTIFAAFYTLLKIAGLGVGALLLWFEVDQYNPTLQSFCSGGSNAKIDCNAVLNSEHANIFKGHLSLSVLAFSYFFGSLGFLFFSSFTFSSLSLLGMLSLISIPIISFSVYYQAFVIKQWCKFCMAIQAILVLEIAVVLLAGFQNHSISAPSIPLFLALFLLPIVAWKFIKPLLEKERETNLHKRGLKKIKSNPDVLEGLLLKSRKISSPTEGLGIILKNENAKFNIIKVCNPYCGPCAKAHPFLEELVQRGIINLQMVFTTNVEDDHLANPVRHLLAIDADGDALKTQRALDDWYNAEQKNYKSFSNKYPINGELAFQNKKINDMFNWCKSEHITHTPTLFINGHELPNEYSVEDLKEVLV